MTFLRAPTLALVAVLAPTLGAQTATPAPAETTVLEKFIVRESAAYRAGDLRPTSRPVDSVNGFDQSVVEVPRAVTVLTPELMRRFGLENLADLARLGAGTQAANYFGIPGTPYLRGVKATTFFNGMARAYQRNEMPVSFGSLEAIDLVKGPAPVQFGPSPEGGYANLVPKSPFFDRARGAVELSVGSHQRRRAELDYGGPALLGDWPAAYRISVTGQQADSAWRNVGNDHYSVYGALKLRPREDVALFTGAEFYDFHSNENPGWNRVTQDLIDHGEYIIGEPQDITGAAWGGRADRSQIEAPGAFAGKPANFRALIVPAATAQARVAPGLLALLEDRRATDGGYRYTQAYFDGGGRVLTAKIDGAQVLSDPRDYADARDFLWFLDAAFERGRDRTLTLKSLVEWLSTDKHSSYGYAIATEQLVAEQKLVWEQTGLPHDTRLLAGATVRFNHGWTVQDFAAEPFNRRDISRADVSPNSVVAAGADPGPTGQNFWSTTIGGSTESDLWQGGVFATAVTRWSPRLETTASFRADTLHFRARLPAEADRATAAQRLAAARSGGKTLGSGTVSATWFVAPRTTAYATYQRGTVLQPGQGGTVNSGSNFAAAWLKELGAKTSLWDERLFASLALYEWKSSRFDDRENRAERLRGRGAELELTFVAGPRLSLIASAGAQRVFRLDPLGFRARDGTAERIALESGSFDAGVTPTPPANPRLIYPGTPETQAKIDAEYRIGAGWSASLGAVWSHAFYHNFERTLVLPESLVWRGSVTWRRGRWHARLSAENLFNADYFLGADPNFSHNDLVTKAPLREIRFSAGWVF